MKTFILSILLFLLAHINISYAQWFSQLDYNYPLSDIMFLNNNTGFVTIGGAGISGSNNGGILKTTNGGNNWEIQVSGLEFLVSLDYVNNKLFAFGNSNIFLLSTDFGNSWILKNHNMSSIASSFFINENTGWISGWPSQIQKTTNAGTNWFIQYSEAIAHPVVDVYFVNQSIGIALIYGTGNIIRTSNSGLNWNVVFTGGTYENSIRKIFYIDNKFYVVGGTLSTGYSKILYSTNQGLNWRDDSSSIGYCGNTIFFIDSNSGIVAGNNGWVYRTTNGGNNWIRQIISNSFSSVNFFFINPNTGWVVGDNSIYKTTNGGWDIPTQPTLIHPPNNITILYDTLTFNWSNSINAVTYNLQISIDTNFITTIVDTNFIYNTFLFRRILIPNVYYWRVRANGIIGNSLWSLKRKFTYLSTGITQINSSIPKSFKLYNNYPNPFNPVTQIIFDIPKLANAQLLIYDVTGKLVETLVNQKINAGNYKVNFDGSKYSSGIYFYQLVTNDFNETERMILIK